jgi:TRAP-type uncharacterized transport system substrate-binding protein
MLIIIILFIIIIFYILNKYIKQNIKEHYLTYYLPYYDNKNTDLSLFYKNNENNDNYFKKKFKYNVLKFGSILGEKNYIESVISNYIKYSYAVNLEIIYYKNHINIVDDIVNNKIAFCDTVLPNIIYYKDVLKKNINNLRLMGRLYKLYYYFFTKKIYNVFSINDIPPYFIIGIRDKQDLYFSYENILKNLSYIENIDYKIKLYKDLTSLLDGFNNSECHMIIINDIFPNQQISQFLDKTYNKDIILLEFNIPNEEIFLKKQSFLKTNYIDLNKLSYYYLPNNIDKYVYSKNKPMLKILYTFKVIITNLNTPDEYVYEMFKFLFEEYKTLNSNLEEGFHLDKLNPSSNNLFEYHKGVLNYFVEKGYITNTNNNNCKYLVGQIKCNENTLKLNGLEFSI